MKVLFLSRKNLLADRGGDTVQVLKTAEALRRRGIAVDLSTELEPDLRGYDLAHVFNLTRPQESLLQIWSAKQKGLPVALSTIFVDYTESDQKARRWIFAGAARLLGASRFEELKILGRAIRGQEFHRGVAKVLARGYDASLRDACFMADVLLPNSFSEVARLEKNLGSKMEAPVCVVPNAVDTGLFSEEKTVIPEVLQKYRGGILCVSRIEVRKNQINLVRAARSFSVPLLLAGDPAPNQRKYYQRLRKEAGENVIFLGYKPPEELRVYYKLCKIHALVSWMETTGLSSLEAGAMGANLVITDRGDTREYFGDNAFYCEPGSVDSIRTALQQALSAKPSADLQARIRKLYTWEKAAEETLKGYEVAFSRKGMRK